MRKDLSQSASKILDSLYNFSSDAEEHCSALRKPLQEIRAVQSAKVTKFSIIGKRKKTDEIDTSQFSERCMTTTDDDVKPKVHFESPD